MDDLLIRGGQVVDGSGAPAVEADVCVCDGRITQVAPRSSRSARREIDARGQVVAPGFIDIHAHSDFTLPLNPRAESKIRQGVTTEVVGNCGYSVAPALPGTAGMLKEYLNHSAPWLTFRDTTFREYLDTYPATSVNVAHQVGHNTLRLMAMGMQRREATADELQLMASLLEEALEAGAIGMSSGVFTAPGAYAAPDELMYLARVLARHGGRYSAHVRDEGSTVFESVREAIAVARGTGVHTLISHLKVAGAHNWGRSGELLAEIEAARREGVPVNCDQHPYEFGSFPLRNLLPSWLHEGGLPMLLERLKDDGVRQRLRHDVVRDGLVNSDWDDVRVSISPNQPELAGRSLADIARERRRDVFDQVCDCILTDAGHMRILFRACAQKDVDAIAGTPWVLVGSDGNSLAVHGITHQGKPHPRFYGAHARVLARYVRELGVLTIEQAVHKMTGGSAAALGWSDRGLLKKGFAADVVVFDPERIADLATYDDPHQYATGVSTVVVNGKLVIEDGDHNGALPGRVLRR